MGFSVAFSIFLVLYLAFAIFEFGFGCVADKAVEAFASFWFS